MRPGKLTQAALFLFWAAGAGLGPAANRGLAQDPPGEQPLRDMYGDPLPDGAVARLGSARLRHGHIMSGLVFSGDGQSIIASDYYRGVRVWNVAEGRVDRRFFTDDHFCHQLAVSPDGRTVAVALGDLSVRLCDPSTGRETGALPKQEGRLNYLVFSPDGKLLATAPGGKSAFVWDVAARKLAYKVTFLDAVGRVAFSADGKRLACGVGDGLRLWDLAQGKEVGGLRHESDARRPLHAVFAPGGGPLAVWGYDDGSVRLFDADGAKEIRRLNRDGADTKAPDMWGWGYALKACFSPDGKRLAVVRDVGRIELWDVAAGKIRHSLTYDGYGRASLLAFSPDGARLASASGDLWGGDNRIRVWDAVKGRELYPNAGHGAPIASLAISPAGATVATAGQDGAVHVWDYRTGKHVMRLDGGWGRAPHVSFSGDGGRVIGLGPYRGDSALRVWAADTGRAVTRVDLPNAEAYWTAVTPDGRTAFAVDLKAKAGRTYDLITGKLTREDTTAAYFENSPRSVSPRGDAVVNMSGRLLTGADRKERLQVGSVFTQNYSAAFTADGRRLVAAVSKKRDFDFRTEPPAEEIVVIDPVAGRELRRFDAVGGTAGAINAAAVSPDGKTVVTVADAGPEAEEQIVTLWEAETGRPRGRFRGHIGPVKSVAVSGDGRFIVTGGADTTALVWDAAKPLAMSSAARRRPAGADAKACLNDLAGADAEQAYASQRALIDAPKETVAFLAGQPALFARADGAAVHRLIRELNSDAYAGRERAARDLGLIADDAEPYLRQALRGDVSAEARRRIDGLLAAQRDGFTGPGLQKVRVIEVLEHVAAATGDTTRMAAAALLTKLAAAPETRLTQEATAALARLGRQADGKR